MDISRCAIDAFTLPEFDTFPAIEVLSLSVEPVLGYNQYVDVAYYPNHYSVDVKDANFCNITLTYKHIGGAPEDEDLVSVESWLPLEGWNERIKVAGGAGWGSGRFPMAYGTMSGAVFEGYATASTDGGTGDQYSASWALMEDGRTNKQVVEDWAYVAVADLAVIIKALVNTYYGKPALYSYFNGCSAGGRQGYQLAQHFPEAFDGIAAAAPAIFWSYWNPSMYWPQLIMNELGEYPRGCELEEINRDVLARCDPLDGVIDGIISDPDACIFDVFETVGKVFFCEDTMAMHEISNAAAVVANATWAGPSDPDGRFFWFGPNYGSELGGGLGMANTVCSRQGSVLGSEGAAVDQCVGSPYSVSVDWLKFFAAKDPKFDVAGMTHEEYSKLVWAATDEFNYLLGANDPDLQFLNFFGGKLITYHGLADGIIPEKGTRRYWELARERTGDLSSFYKYYQVPGMGHCSGGTGGYPSTIFDALRAWVENGTEPGTLPVEFVDHMGRKNERDLCPYPAKSFFVEGCEDTASRKCFECRLPEEEGVLEGDRGFGDVDQG